MATSTPMRTVSSFICHSCRAHLKPRTPSQRDFSTVPRRRAGGPSDIERVFQPTFRDSRRNNRFNPRPQVGGNTAAPSFMAALDAEPAKMESLLADDARADLNAINEGQKKAHRLHIYATKHNTHITLVQPQRPASETASLRLAGSKSSATEQKKMVDVLLSVSAGNIGFKKAGRGSYDAAFQLAAYVLRQMQDKGMIGTIRDLEVVLRGFGAGRDAVPKVLLGTEGRLVRDKISAVIDATRLKQGGPRSRAPRRLG